MINEILIISAFTSVWVLGLTIVTQQDMALGSLREWATEKEKPWFKPIILCVWCMPSVHSLVGCGFALLFDYTELTYKLVIAYPIIVMLGSLISGLIWTMYSLMDTAMQFFTNGEKALYIHIKEKKEEAKYKNNNNKNRNYGNKQKEPQHQYFPKRNEEKR